METHDEVVAATRRLAAEGLVTEVQDGVTCCHALQDKVWVDGPDTRWEVYTVVADSPQAGGDCCSTAATEVPEGVSAAAVCCAGR